MGSDAGGVEGRGPKKVVGLVAAAPDESLNSFPGLFHSHRSMQACANDIAGKGLSLPSGLTGAYPETNVPYPGETS